MWCHRLQHCHHPDNLFGGKSCREDGQTIRGKISCSEDSILERAKLRGSEVASGVLCNSQVFALHNRGTGNDVVTSFGSMESNRPICNSIGSSKVEVCVCEKEGRLLVGTGVASNIKLGMLASEISNFTLCYVFRRAAIAICWIKLRC